MSKQAQIWKKKSFWQGQYFLISYSGKLAGKGVRINYNRVNVYKSNNVKALNDLYPLLSKQSALTTTLSCFL